MTPIAPMKSSTESSLSALVFTFLKNLPANGFAGGAAGAACPLAMPVQARPIRQQSAALTGGFLKPAIFYLVPTRLAEDPALISRPSENFTALAFAIFEESFAR